MVIQAVEGEFLFPDGNAEGSSPAGIIYFDKQNGEWSWSLERLEALPVHDSVVDFLVGQLQHLLGRSAIS